MDELKTENLPTFCVCMAMRKASRTISKLYDEALLPSGLKVTQFSILMSIRTHGPVNVSTLAKLQSLDRTTLVRTLKPLETALMIESIPSNDPRERQMRITDHGLQTIKLALPRWKKIQQKVAQKFSAEQMKMFKNFSNSLVEIFESEEEKIKV